MIMSKKGYISLIITVVIVFVIFLYPLTYYRPQVTCLAIGCPTDFEMQALFLLKQFPFFLK